MSDGNNHEHTLAIDTFSTFETVSIIGTVSNNGTLVLLEPLYSMQHLKKQVQLLNTGSGRKS